MGSFRSARSRASDTDTLTPDNCPALSAGESVTYLTTLPHRVAVRIADEAAMPVIDGKGRVTGLKLRSGTVSVIKLEEGIVGWTMFDEDGAEVRWDRTKAIELVAGLDEDVRVALLAVIDGGRPPELDATDPVTEEPEGNASGES